MKKQEAMNKAKIAGERAIEDSDWEEVAAVYKACNWTWGGDTIPTVEDLKNKAYELVGSLFKYQDEGDNIKESFATTGRIMVEASILEDTSVTVRISISSYIGNGYSI